jgi:predicted nucleic-acid-binding protein
VTLVGLDTNVLVRYFTQDDVTQAASASILIDNLDEENRGFISLIVLVELHWVLRRSYRTNRDQVLSVIRKLLDTHELVVQDSDSVRRALAQTVGEIDFADALIADLGAQAGCDHTATLNRQAAALPGMKLLS